VIGVSISAVVAGEKKEGKVGRRDLNFLLSCVAREGEKETEHHVFACDPWITSRDRAIGWRGVGIPSLQLGSVTKEGRGDLDELLAGGEGKNAHLSTPAKEKKKKKWGVLHSFSIFPLPGGGKSATKKREKKETILRYSPS